MSGFAKLWEVDTRGQLLALFQQSDDGVPEVRVFAQPENLGVCSVAFSFSDTDDGWDAAEEAFEAFTEQKAIEATQPLFDIAAEADV